MTIDEIVTLIQAVSDNGLTSFVYEEGDQKLVLKKKKKKNVAQAPVAPVVISQPAAPMMGTMPMQMAAAPVSQIPQPERLPSAQCRCRWQPLRLRYLRHRKRQLKRKRRVPWILVLIRL